MRDFNRIVDYILENNINELWYCIEKNRNNNFIFWVYGNTHLESIKRTYKLIQLTPNIYKWDTVLQYMLFSSNPVTLVEYVYNDISDVSKKRFMQDIKNIGNQIDLDFYNEIRPYFEKLRVKQIENLGYSDIENSDIL